jgi:hypothetical protein
MVGEEAELAVLKQRLRKQRAVVKERSSTKINPTSRDAFCHSKGMMPIRTISCSLQFA